MPLSRPLTEKAVQYYPSISLKPGILIAVPPMLHRNVSRSELDGVPDSDRRRNADRDDLEGCPYAMFCMLATQLIAGVHCDDIMLEKFPSDMFNFLHLPTV